MYTLNRDPSHKVVVKRLAYLVSRNPSASMLLFFCGRGARPWSQLIREHELPDSECYQQFLPVAKTRLPLSMPCQDPTDLAKDTALHDELLDLYKTHRVALLRLSTKGNALDNVGEAVLGMVVEALQEDISLEAANKWLSYSGRVLEAFSALSGEELANTCESLREHIDLGSAYVELAAKRKEVFSDQSCSQRKQWCEDHSKELTSMRAALSSCKSRVAIPKLAGMLVSAEDLATDIGDDVKRGLMQQWEHCIQKLETVHKKGATWKIALPKKATWEQVKKAGQALSSATLARDLKNAYTQACKDSCSVVSHIHGSILMCTPKS